MATKPLLDVRSVSKSFGSLKAVNEVSFQVVAGEIFGIAGPNGSGKSTLFNALTAIPFRGDQGEVYLDDIPLHRLPPHRIVKAGLARTFQRETAFDTRSVWENVLVARLHATDVPGALSAENDVRDTMEFTRISHEEYHRQASEVSVFTKKKVMIASALVMRPKVLLMDEPAAGLTRPEILETEDLIRRLHKRGITIVLIEHVLPLLLAVSDRLMVLNDGREVVTGLPDDVVNDRRVIASYLGGEAHA